MIVAHLATSAFVGGPERLILGLTLALPPSCRGPLFLFAERGQSQRFADRLRGHSLEPVTLTGDTPNFRAMVAELAGRIRELEVGVLCCHGYKADFVGLLAARKAGIPVIAMSHGWTAETWKVRAYEALDRFALRRMDRVVCVSEGQASKVRRAGVRAERVAVVRNAVQAERFDRTDPADRRVLDAMFPGVPERIVGSAGRLNPEKGFGVLVEAAAIVARSDPGVGFIHFGDGPLREPIRNRVIELGLEGRFILAGFRDDLDRFLPHLDLFVLPSFTEGLPTVVLESYAAGVPVVATAVGGTPETIADGVDGLLVPPGDPAALAGSIAILVSDEGRRLAMGRLGRQRIRAEFTFDLQARRFLDLCTDASSAGRQVVRHTTP